MKSSVDNVKRLKGDGLRVNMDLNDLNLKVSGDGCRVTVERNCGLIRVHGDGCSLKVNCNDGDIEYKGDGGSIYLGGGSRTESVSYVGDGGRISVKSSEKFLRPDKKRSGKNKDAKSRCPSLSDSELEAKLDNLANEGKEKRREKSRNLDGTGAPNTGDKTIKEKNLRRSKTIVVTKITSEEIPVNINGNSLIKNWFRNSPTIIRSSKSGPESL